MSRNIIKTPPPSFTSYLGVLAPFTPLDNKKLEGAANPRLIYVKQTRQVECDLTGLKSKKMNIEKIYAKVLKRLESYEVDYVSDIDQAHLEALYVQINNQTQCYKDKYSDCFGQIRLIWRGIFGPGHIDTLTDKLLGKIEALRTLPHAPKALDKARSAALKLTSEEGDAAIKEAQRLVNQELNNKRLEFKMKQDRFCLSLGAAVTNLQVLLQMRETSTVLCQDPFFRSDEEPSLISCKKVFDDLYLKALEIQEYMNDALNTGSPDFQSKALAEIYTTDEYHNYSELLAEATDYYKPLEDLIKALTEENVFDEEIIKDLDLYGQPESQPGFERNPNLKLQSIIHTCYAPAMQHAIHQVMLMEELAKATPYEATEYAVVHQGAIEAKRNAGSVNFGFKK